MTRIDALEKALQENEYFLFFQTNKKIIKKHKKISEILKKEISDEILLWAEQNPVSEEIQNLSDDELLLELLK